ncbi:MAG: hypothetical protein ABIC91_07000 [Nanoarchaeota archaeon]|nr:hypothetical protein [Nanoarchaeota archaeon]MBU1030011.1 hypothetical protein [Nanoarchaeota archaeon]MBU1850197.1 hypothetical protein [Nanoarchaeota archaeon]
MIEKTDQLLSKLFPDKKNKSSDIHIPTSEELVKLHLLDVELQKQMQQTKTTSILEHILTYASQKGYLLHGSYADIPQIDPRLELLDCNVPKEKQIAVVNATSCPAIALFWATINKNKLIKEYGRKGMIVYDADEKRFSVSPEVFNTRSDGYVYIVPNDHFFEVKKAEYKFQSYNSVQPVAKIPVVKDVDFKYQLGIIFPKLRKR